MGRILVYTTSGCTHCVRAKHLLQEKHVPFHVIDLLEHPERRQEMFLLSNGNKTVPQIFFNQDHIGVTTAD